jgi:peptide/nickel transport system substrate-binding protein
MRRGTRGLAATIVLLTVATASQGALGQKQGGILRLYHFDSPASMSILEEAGAVTVIPMMAVFNNLVLYDQSVPQNSLQAIVPDLATQWSWDQSGTRLTFKLRHGVEWHDGQPFTAADVKCTWDLLMGIGSDKLRLNPRKSWYGNLEEVTTHGDDEVTFRLKRPQPALLALLASGVSPIYPCHVPARDMRQHPIGTGPFKFVEYKPNERITLSRNAHYWKTGRPYLDGIEYTIIRDVSTANLAFTAGQLEMTHPVFTQIPVLQELQRADPEAICRVVPSNVSRNLIINRTAPPLDNPDLRRAMSLALDRKAFVDILTGGKGDIGGAMLPPPEGVWGMPQNVLQTLPGYDSDAQKNRDIARQIMEKLGYGPNNRLKLKVSARTIPITRDPAVILIDQLKEIYIDGELDAVESANWFPKVIRRDFSVGLNLTGKSVDDPDQNFFENYVCGAQGNYDGYCNHEIDQLIERQSAEPDQEKRRELVWEIERKLAEDVARPIIFYPRAATCWHPYVKGLNIMVNSIYNGWRFEDVWLDR